jgi:hypothetical protein
MAASSSTTSTFSGVAFDALQIGADLASNGVVVVVMDWAVLYFVEYSHISA